MNLKFKCDCGHDIKHYFEIDDNHPFNCENCLNQYFLQYNFDEDTIKILKLIEGNYKIEI